MFHNLFDFSNPLTLFGGQKRAAAQQKARGVFNQQFSNLPSSFGGRPNSFVFPTGTPVVRPQAYIPPFPIPPRIPLSAAGEAFRLESQASQGAGPGLPVGTFTDGRTVTQPPVVPKPALDPPSTNGVSQPFRYSNVLPPLTAAQQRALQERRRLATRSFNETEAQVGRETDRAEGDVLRQQGDLDRARREQSRSGQQTLAGRGVGRSPMFVNPFERRLTESAQRQTAELQSGLAGTLSRLQSVLQQAEITRDREYAQIEFDATDERSDVDRLLGA